MLFHIQLDNILSVSHNYDLKWHLYSGMKDSSLNSLLSLPS